MSETATKLATALAKLDGWLETMRGPDGYGGPVAHWWESNFLYTGALYDWRYEGVIDGYVELYVRTGETRFLVRARRAADEVAAQLCEDGRFRKSSFQFGPVRGGTPHEAALDVALLKLARILKGERADGWQRYVDVAAHNLEAYWLGVLWNGRGFRDQPYKDGLIPNKNGTALEALLEYQALSDKDCGEYIAACVRVVTEGQVDGGDQAGGIVHIGTGAPRLAIPIYTARGLNGLLAYYEATGDGSVLETVRRAVPFFERLLQGPGVYWGVYGSGQLCPNPTIIAGAGDVLRCLHRTAELEVADTAALAERLASTLIAQQQPGGGLPTAYGFRRKGLGGQAFGWDLRDVLPVVGWTDKSFRALALMLAPGKPLAEPSLETYEQTVYWRRTKGIFRETPEAMSFSSAQGEPLYHWEKGAPAPSLYRL